MLDHTGVSVTDPRRSRRFYEEAPQTPPVRVAFRAESRAVVDAF